MKVSQLLDFGIPIRRIRICKWCPEAFAYPQQVPHALKHQQKCHGYVGPTKPKFLRGGVLGLL